MSKSLPPVWFTSLLDDNGNLLAGGKLQSYAAGTTTPLATYSDADGAANANPLVLDSSGRGAIWLTVDVAYKFVLSDSDDNVLFTVDDITAISGIADVTTAYEVILTYCETPGAQAFMGGEVVKRAVSFPVDFTGSGGAVQTNPGAEYVISIQKNDVEVGTATIDTSGTFTFATTGGSTVSLISGDQISFVGPDTVGTAANFMITLVGSL
jgi:hypothetical protein